MGGDERREESSDGLSVRTAAAAAERLAAGTYHETGIAIDPEVERDGRTVMASVRGRDLCLVPLDSWDCPDEADREAAGERLGDLLFRRAVDAGLSDRLVDIERDHLRSSALPDVEAAFASRLEAAGEPLDDVEPDVVDVGYEYHHGEPQAAQETGYPSFGLEAWWPGPDRRVVVAFGRRSEDVGELAQQALDRLQTGTDDW